MGQRPALDFSRAARFDRFLVTTLSWRNSMGRFDAEAGPVSLRSLLELTAAARRVGIDIDAGRWLVRPYVAGVEVTQGIQYFGAERHLTDPKDRGRDNSLRLVARKPAWVRVYVRSGIFGASQELTGELVVEHRTGAFLAEWQEVARLPALFPASVFSQTDPDYATERGAILSTLNFGVSAALMEGMVRFTARTWAAGDATRTPIDSWQETVDATLLQTLSLRGVFVHYHGPDPTINANNPPTVDLPAPGLANLQATAAWTLTTNPVEAFAIFSSAGQMNWFAPLTGAATTSGGCSDGWIGLTYWLSLIKQNDGNRNDVIYYGLLPANAPVGPVTGCELHGVSAGRDTDQVAMAHEIGHGAKLAHAPCGLPRFLLVSTDTSLTFVPNPTIDQDYPAYEPYDPSNSPTASIGEYGLDITDGTIHPPTEKDYMSYCPPTMWISIFHHAKLSYNDAFNPRRVGVQRWQPPDLVDPYLWPWEYIPDPPQWVGGPGERRMRAEPVIAILGTVGETRALEVQNVMRLQALPMTSGSVSTPYVAQLVGANGEILAAAPVVRLRAHGGGCGCGHNDAGDGPFVFQAMVPDAAPGAELRIVKRDEEDRLGEIAWTRRAPERPPVIRKFAVSVSRGYAYATWQGRGEGTLEFSLQFSKDRGRSWNGVAVGLTGSEYRFRAETLPSGSLLFRLLAHDGFHTTTRVSRPVAISPRPPCVAILSPQAGRPFFATAPVRLWGAVTEDDGVPVDPDACEWLVDGQSVGRGLDAWIAAPSPGQHQCTLIVRGRGGTARVDATLLTLDPAETDPQRLAGGQPSTTAAGASARKRRGGGRRRKRRSKSG
jgi:hypothetical protein